MPEALTSKILLVQLEVITGVVDFRSISNSSIPVTKHIPNLLGQATGSNEVGGTY